MSEPHLSTESANRAPLAFGEFVALIASMMALTALGIDSMLPALPAIGESLGVSEPNDRQYVITAFLLGFAVAQLAYGPLSDRFGRRPVLAIALASYVITSGLAAISGSFELLLLSRALMGTAAAGARVVTVALVRDCFSGRAMARVMSLAFIVFMAAPIFAPAFGQAVLWAGGSWRMIFWGVAAVSALVVLWFWLRMPETLAAEARQSLSPARILADYGLVFRDRTAVGYTIAAALLSGGLFGFIGSFLNSRIVMHLGTRRISHSALAGLTAIAGVHLLVAELGGESIWVFAVLQALMMACFGLATSNFSAMAMERMGAIAGTASSLQGFVTTLAGALIGAQIGQAFDGTTVPLYTGFLLMGALALVTVAITERGRMFRPS